MTEGCKGFSLPVVRPWDFHRANNTVTTAQSFREQAGGRVSNMCRAPEQKHRRINDGMIITSEAQDLLTVVSVT